MDGVGNTGLTTKSGRLEALRSCGLDALMVGVRVLRGSFGYGNWWGDAAQPRRFEHAFCGLGTWLCMFGGRFDCGVGCRIGWSGGGEVSYPDEPSREAAEVPDNIMNDMVGLDGFRWASSTRYGHSGPSMVKLLWH